jgi:hypothetical protein
VAQAFSPCSQCRDKPTPARIEDLAKEELLPLLIWVILALLTSDVRQLSELDRVLEFAFVIDGSRSVTSLSQFHLHVTQRHGLLVPHGSIFHIFVLVCLIVDLGDSLAFTLVLVLALSLACAVRGGSDGFGLMVLVDGLLDQLIELLGALLDSSILCGGA